VITARCVVHAEENMTDPIDEIRLRSIVPLRTPTRELRREPVPSAEQITGLSRETLKRRFPQLIRQISDRRCGMQLADALAIAAGEAVAA
jgi:hypothetical protein